MNAQTTDNRHATTDQDIANLGSIRWVRPAKNKVNFGAGRLESITMTLVAFGNSMAAQLLALERLASLVGPMPAKTDKFAQAFDMSEFENLGGVDLLCGIHTGRRLMLEHGVLTGEDYSKVIQFGIHQATGEKNPLLLAKREVELHANFETLWGRAELRRLNSEIAAAT